MINNNIEESYCNFEVCKLLKEKGFDVSFVNIINENDLLVHDQGYLFNYLDRKNVFRFPSQSIAVKWLRENFKIIITVTPFVEYNNICFPFKSIENSEVFHQK